MVDAPYPKESIPVMAREFGVSDETLYRLVRSGDLPATKLGRSIRVRREDVEALVRPTCLVDKSLDISDHDPITRKIADLIEAAPPLSEETKERLRALLQGAA